MRVCGHVYPSRPFSVLRGEVVHKGTAQGVRTRRVVVGPDVPLRPQQTGGTCAYADGYRAGSTSFGHSCYDNRANPRWSDFGPRPHPLLHAKGKGNRPHARTAVLSGLK